MKIPITAGNKCVIIDKGRGKGSLEVANSGRLKLKGMKEWENESLEVQRLKPRPNIV